jgi:hypothetical protein
MNRHKYSSIIGMALVLGLIPRAYAEPRIESGCLKKSTPAECLSCYLDYGNRMHATCLNQNPGALDLYGAGMQVPRIQECEANLGVVSAGQAEEICKNIIVDYGDQDEVHQTTEPGLLLPGDNVPIPRERPADLGKKTTKKTTTNTNSNTIKNNGNTTAQAATTDPSQVQAQISADQAQCAGLQRTAVSCCANPSSCLTDTEAAQVQAANAQVSSISAGLNQTNTSTPTGLSSYCQQTQQLGQAGSQINNAYATACYRGHSGCEMTCSSLASKYRQLLSGCSGSTCSLYQSAVSYFDNTGRSCQTLSAQSVQVANQSMNSATATGGGSACQQITQAAPQSGFPSSSTGAAANDPYGCLANPNSQACLQCTTHPGSPACLALANANTLARGEDGFQGQSASDKDQDINLPDIGDLSVQGGGFSVSPTAATPPSVGMVPNNSGGGVPGEGSSPAAPVLAATANQKPSPGAPGYTTDIDKGFRDGSGGGAGGYAPSYAANLDSSSASRFGFARRGGKHGDDGASRTYLDLKAYLPGGSRDPSGRIGGRKRIAPDINGPFVDMWKLISDRIQEKCRLGELIDCR